MRSDGSAYKASVNGADETLTVNTGANNGDWFGDVALRDVVDIGMLARNSPNYFWDGYIADVLIYDRELNDIELGKVERKLATMYGVTLS